MPDGASVTVPPQIVFPRVNTATELRDLDSDDQVNGQPVMLLGNVAIGDGLGTFMYWSSLSTAVDNGTTIIRPDDRTSVQAGRWIAVGYPDTTIPPLTRTVSTGTYTVVPADMYRVLRFTVTCLVTLPLDMVADFIAFWRVVGAAAVVTFEVEGGDPPNEPSGLDSSYAQWAQGSISVDSNVDDESAVWVLSGATG